MQTFQCYEKEKPLPCCSSQSGRHNFKDHASNILHPGTPQASGLDINRRVIFNKSARASVPCMFINMEAAIRNGRRGCHRLKSLGRMTDRLRRLLRREGVHLFTARVMLHALICAVLGWRWWSLRRLVFIWLHLRTRSGRLFEQALQQFTDRRSAAANNAQAKLELTPYQEVPDGICVFDDQYLS